MGDRKWTRACRNCSGVLQSNSWPTETPLTLLGSMRELDDGELPELYDYPEQDGTWVRANFITSVDGGATADGTSGGWRARRQDDLQPAARTRRRHRGRRGHRADRGLLRRAPRRRPAAAPAGPRAKRSPAAGDRHQVGSPGPGHAGVHPHRGAAVGAHLHGGRRRDAPTARRPVPRWSTAPATIPAKVDEAALLATLAARGLRRILTEGGPMLLGSFVQRDLLDDLCLTIAPYRRRRTGPTHRDRPRPGADPDALRARPHRRRRLPLHALRRS